MSRKKGLKRWDVITRDGWLQIMADSSIMTHLMMDIFDRLYDSENYMDNGKSIAGALHMEYRALNAGVGWAGNKIRELIESGSVSVYPASGKEDREEMWDTLLPSDADGSSEKKERPAWEYIFDGAVGEDGVYYWILKPETASAYREIREAGNLLAHHIRHILEEDESSLGMEGSLFASSAESTVCRIRKELEEESWFQRKSMAEHPCCLVCGAERISLLKAVPYEEGDRKVKGPVFCPIHGALFAAHLISYDHNGKLLISPALSDEERELFHLEIGSAARAPFRRRRMASHRKIFSQEARKLK